MESTINLDAIIRKVSSHSSLDTGEEVGITIDLATGKAIEKNFWARVSGNFQDYVVANERNPLHVAEGMLPAYYVRDAAGGRTLAIQINLTGIACPIGQEVKLAEALHNEQSPGAVLSSLVQRWVRAFISPVTEGWFIDTYDSARNQLQNTIVNRALEVGLKLSAKVDLSGRHEIDTKSVLGPLEIGVRLKGYTEEQKIVVEAGLALDPQTYVRAFIFQENQRSPEALFKECLKEYFFTDVTYDQFNRDLSYPHFKQGLIQSLSLALKRCGRRVEFINLSRSKPVGSGPVPPPEFKALTYNCNYNIHGRLNPVTIENTVQLNCENSVAFLASDVEDLDAWTKNTLDIVLKRHLIGKTYVDLLLRFDPIEQAIKREMSLRALAIGYRVDHLVTIPSLKEKELRNPFLLETEDTTFETRLDNFEVQVKFMAKLCIPKLEAIEKYLNPGTDVKEAIKDVILSEARECLRTIHPERFYLFFNTRNEEAKPESERVAVKDVLSKVIQDALKREFSPKIFDLVMRVGRTDLKDRYRNLCFVIRSFRVSIDSPDPQATEDLTLTGNFELRGVWPDSQGWQRFSVLQLDLDGLQEQLETHLRAELKTYYQASFMFQNRLGRQQVFNVVRNCADLYMRQEFGLIVHLTNLDRNTTRAEEHQRKLLLDFENTRLADLVDQSEHLTARLKQLRKKRIVLLSTVSDEETLREVEDQIHTLEAELEGIASHLRPHRLATESEQKVPDQLPPLSEEELNVPRAELAPEPKAQLTS